MKVFLNIDIYNCLVQKIEQNVILFLEKFVIQIDPRAKTHEFI